MNRLDLTRLVTERLRHHPLVQAAWAEGKRVEVSASYRAIRLRVVPKDPDQKEIEILYEGEQWWNGGPYTKEDWARRLANTLAGEMKEKWQGREKPKMGQRD